MPSAWVLETVVAGAHDGLLVVDAGGVVRFANPAAAELTGRRLARLPGARLASLAHPDDAAALADSGVPAVGRTELRLGAGPGRWRDIELSVGPGLPLDGAARRVPLRPLGGRRRARGRVTSPGGASQQLHTLVLRDVSERVVAQRRLEERARLDALTALPNRDWFRSQLAERLATATATATATDNGSCSAVLFVDLDDFKRVNDTAGHAAGDRLLAMAAHRLAHCLRGDDLVGRLSGDEFAAYVTADTEEDVLAVSRRVREQLAAPYSLAGLRARVSASVGLAFVEPDSSVASLLRAADLAMYEAKRHGGARLATFRPDMLAAAGDGATGRAVMQAAVERGELAVHYRPRVRLTGGPSGGELVEVVAEPHWPAAVSSGDGGLGCELTRLVLSRAVEQASRWHRAGRALPVVVELPAALLADQALPGAVAGLLARVGLPPARLLLRVPERELVGRAEHVVEPLLRLRRLGVRLAVGDVGSSFACLGLLPSLPVDEVTLLGGRLREAIGSPRAAAVLRAVTALARDLDLEPAVGGLDDSDQLALARDLGVAVGEGELFGAAVPATAVPRRVALPALAGATGGEAAPPVALPATRQPAPKQPAPKQPAPKQPDPSVCSSVPSVAG